MAFLFLVTIFVEQDGRCRGLVTVGVIGRLLGVPELPDQSPRIHQSPPTRHRLATMRGSRGDWPRFPNRGLVRTRGCLHPHSLPSRLNAQRRTLTGARCHPDVVDHGSSSENSQSPRLSIKALLLLPPPGIPHHAFSERRFGASACMTPLARSFTDAPRGRTPAGFEGGERPLTAPTR